MARKAWSLVHLCALLVVSGGAQGRPFQVDDLLRQEAFGDVLLDPTGRRLLIERRGPYETAHRFAYGHSNAIAVSRLLLADLDTGGPAQSLIPQTHDCGYRAGPWAPDGIRIAVYRLCGERWELGVANAISRKVRWLGVTPASNTTGRSVQWRSDAALLVISRPAQDPPWELRTGWQSSAKLPARWARAARGVTAGTAIGSGAFRDITGPAPVSRLLEVNAVTGGARELARGAFVDLELSAGGRYVAMLETGERLQPGPDKRPQGPWGTASEAQHLAVLDLRTRLLVRPCPACDLLRTLLSWAPASDSLLVFSRGANAPWTDGAFQIFDAREQAFHQLDAGGLQPVLRLRPETIRTGWWGDTPIIQARVAGGHADWWGLGPAGSVNLTAGMGEAVEMIATGTCLTALSSGELWAIGPDGARSLLSRGQRRANWASASTSPRLQAVVDAKAGAAATLQGDQLRLRDGRLVEPHAPADEALVAYSTATGALISRRTSPQGVSELLLRRSGRRVQVLSLINLPFANLDAPRIVPVRHRGTKGESLTSWLYLPPGGGHPPLIVRPYLGDNYRTPPADRQPVLSLAADVRVLLGRGYAVLLPSLPLPMGVGEPLAGVGQRVLEIVDAAAAQAPGAFDAQSLALWGHSYGGYTALGVAAQTDRFFAVITMGAPTDLISLYGVFQPSWRVSPEDGVWPAWPAGWAEDSQGRMGAPPWAATERYARNSPVLMADRIRTPVLLIHGDQDAIPMTQAEEMFSALHRQNKDAVIVTYWGEGHIISSPGNVRDLYTRAFAFLEKYRSAQPRRSD